MNMRLRMHKHHEAEARLQRVIEMGHAAVAARIAELEAALREIAAGEIDEGGNVRMRQDSMQIAHRALYPNG